MIKSELAKSIKNPDWMYIKYGKYFHRCAIKFAISVTSSNCVQQKGKNGLVDSYKNFVF